MKIEYENKTLELEKADNLLLIERLFRYSDELREILHNYQNKFRRCTAAHTRKQSVKLFENDFLIKFMREIIEAVVNTEVLRIKSDSP